MHIESFHPYLKYYNNTSNKDPVLTQALNTDIFTITQDQAIDVVDSFGKAVYPIPELIVCAANRYVIQNSDGAIEYVNVLGIRHGCPAMQCHIDLLEDKLIVPIPWEGFYTNKHRFVSRNEALQIATKNHQIRRITSKGEGNNIRILYSEDIH